MNPNNIELALRRVIEHCESIIRLENRPSDDEIELSETIFKMIDEELNKK